MTSSIIWTDSLNNDDSPSLENLAAVESGVIGSDTFVFAAGGKGITVLLLDPATGDLTAVEDIVDGGTDAAGSPVQNIDNIEDLTVIQTGGKTFVLSAALEGAITVFEVSGTGELTKVAEDTDSDGSDSNLLANASAIDHLTVDGTTYVYAAGDEDAVVVYEIDPTTGGLTHRPDLDVSDDNSTAGSSLDISKLGNISSMASTAVDGKSYLAVAADGDKSITLFEVANDGSLTSLDVETDGDTGAGSAIQNEIDGLNDVEFAQINGKTFLVTAEAADNGHIQVFLLNSATGTLTNVFSIDDGALDASGAVVENIRRIENISIYENGGSTFVFAASKSDDSASVFRLDDSGGLTLDHQFLDDGNTAYKDSFAGAAIQADDGSIHYLQGGSEGISASSFTPCFATGTRILTPDGPVAVEELVAGDRVCTLDSGSQPVAWTFSRQLEFPEAGESMIPIVIPSNAFGSGIPSSDLILSPQHAICLSLPCMGQTLVRAKALVGRLGVRQKRGCVQVTYHTVMLSKHEIIFAENTLVESFYPGPEALKAIGARGLKSLQKVFGQNSNKTILRMYGDRARPAISVGSAMAAIAPVNKTGLIQMARSFRD